MPDEITLRTPTQDEFPRFVAPLSVAFNEEISDAAVENDRHTIELDRFVGAFDGDQVVGCGGAYSFRLTVPGGEVGAAGVTAIGVLPSHRRRGILRQMMTWLFDQARERHEPIAILWASEAAIYQRFGYGPGTVSSAFEIARDKIQFRRPVEVPGRFRLVDVDEATERFPAVYEEVRRSTPGTVNRTDARWRWEVLHDAPWYREGAGPKLRALYEVDGEIRGYVIYRTKGDWDTSGPKGVVLVQELTASDPEAEQALWVWVSGIDLIASVRARRAPLPHPLQLLLTEPRRLGLTVTDGSWIRIIDLAGALEARSYASSGELVLEVADAFCPANDGRWRLSAASGRARVRPAPDAEPDLTLDTSDVAAVYLGAFRFADLRRAGRVRECRAGAIAEADALFRTEVAPLTSTMF
ncbi:MAG: GNAT family N-acetyltransferase [Chloroflexi bacterium]|nr:GNAT family N-acetyltransferase [Chloroflexota bacterium]